jgi:hypothetical protein
VDYPKRNDSEWFYHCHLKKDAQGRMFSFKREVEPYLIHLNEQEEIAYQGLRLKVANS